MPLDSALTKYGVYKPQICTVATTPTSPYVGQTIYRTDTGEFLVYYGATTGWRPPWNQPWGLVGITSATSPNISLSAAVETSTGLSLTFTATANRYYEIVYREGLMTATTNGYAATFVRLTSISGTIVANQYFPTVSSGNGNGGLVVMVRTLTAGSTTLVTSVLNNTVGWAYRSTDYPAVLSVKDIGPATSTAPTS